MSTARAPTAGGGGTRAGQEAGAGYGPLVAARTTPMAQVS